MAHVRALQAPALGTWSEQLRAPSFAGSDFMLSDLQLLLPATVLADVKRELTDDSRAEFQALDIKGASPGKYMLTVAVTDKKRVQTLSRTSEIEIK